MENEKKEEKEIKFKCYLVFTNVFSLLSLNLKSIEALSHGSLPPSPCHTSVAMLCIFEY
jgi:hypothetical protein